MAELKAALWRKLSGGETREECERTIREAIELYVETMRDLGRPLPAPSTEAGQVEIPAA